MGAHSSPVINQQTVDLIDSRELSLTREERGYLKELIRTYKHMFAEQMVAEKFAMCTDAMKRQMFHQKQKDLGETCLTKILASEVQ
tara:strand:+ start:10076 stop:10333 length:258 start_codon:yes stop_codon:yes gene_type:complete